MKRVSSLGSGRCGRGRSFPVRRLLASVLLLTCVGCATPQAPRYHTLMPAERPALRDGASATAGPSITLESVDVPVQVDQPQWLVRLPDDTLALLEQERWASPLRDELRQALLEILTRRYGAIETRSVGTGMPLWRIRVEVTRFDSWPGEARIDATWTVLARAPDAAPLRCSSWLRESAGPGIAALAEAHRRAVARLGDAIGEQLLALQRGERGRCPV